MRRNRRHRLQPPPVIDPVLGPYIMHTRADTIRNRWWTGVALCVLLAAAVAVGLYLGLVQQIS